MLNIKSIEVRYHPSKKWHTLEPEKDFIVGEDQIEFLKAFKHNKGHVRVTDSRTVHTQEVDFNKIRYPYGKN